MDNHWISVATDTPEHCGQYTYSIDVKGLTANMEEVIGHFELESMQFYTENADDTDGYLLITDKITHWKPLIHTQQEKDNWDNSMDN